MTFSLTREALSKLPNISAEIEVRDLANSENKKSSTRKCAALGILILLTGAAAGYLIATTGVPSVNPLLFWGGVGFGGISLSMLLSLVVIVVNTRKLKNELHGYVNASQTEESVYNALIEHEVTMEAVEYAVERMIDEDYTTFFDYAFTKIFGEEEALDLTAEQEQLVKVLVMDDRFIRIQDRTKIFSFLKMLDKQEDIDSIILKYDQFKHNNLVEHAVGIAPSPTMVLKALAKSDHTLKLTPEEQRKLMEKVEIEEAVGIVKRMSDDEYDRLKKHVYEVYFTAAEISPVNQTVLKALFERASRLSSKEIYVFLNYFDEDTAKKAVEILKDDAYLELLKYTLAQPNEKKVTKALASRGVLCKNNFKRSLNAEQRMILITRLAPEISSKLVSELLEDSERAFIELASEIYKAYFESNWVPDPLVISLLYQSADLLTPQQHIAFLGALDHKSEIQDGVDLLGQQQYKDLVGYALDQYFGNDPKAKNVKILNALAQSEYAVNLEPAQQRLLIENIDRVSMNQLVAKLNEEQYDKLVNHIYSAYFVQKTSQKNDQVIIALLLMSKHLGRIGDHQILLSFMECVSQPAAERVIEKMEKERFEKFVAQVCESYFRTQTRQPNLVVIEALYKKNEYLTTNQRFAFFGALGVEKAKVLIMKFKEDEYQNLFSYFCSQDANVEVVQMSLATRPDLFSCLLNNPLMYAIDNVHFLKVYKVMDELQKAFFLQRISDRMGSINDEQNKTERNKIREVVAECMKATVKEEFASSFAAEVSQGRKALLNQFVRWPDEFGKRVADDFKGLGKEKMFEVVWSMMDQNGREIFIETVASIISNPKNEQKIKIDWLMSLNNDGKVHAFNLGILARVIILKAYDYKVFREKVIDNEAISKNQNRRYAFTLDLLEAIGGKEGQNYIKELDKGAIGNKRYNALFNIVVKEIETFNNVEAVPSTRWALYNAFDQAPQRPKRRENSQEWTKFDKLMSRQQTEEKATSPIQMDELEVN